MKARKMYDAFQTSLLKPYHGDQSRRYLNPLSPIKLDDGSEGYEVESIIATKMRKGKQMYLVR